MATDPKLTGPARRTEIRRDLTAPGPFQHITQYHSRDERLYLADLEVIESLPDIGLVTKVVL